MTPTTGWFHRQGPGPSPPDDHSQMYRLRRSGEFLPSTFPEPRGYQAASMATYPPAAAPASSSSAQMPSSSQGPNTGLIHHSPPMAPHALANAMPPGQHHSVKFQPTQTGANTAAMAASMHPRNYPTVGAGGPPQQQQLPTTAALPNRQYPSLPPGMARPPSRYPNHGQRLSGCFNPAIMASNRGGGMPVNMPHSDPRHRPPPPGALRAPPPHQPYSMHFQGGPMTRNPIAAGRLPAMQHMNNSSKAPPSRRLTIANLPGLAVSQSFESTKSSSEQQEVRHASRSPSPPMIPAPPKQAPNSAPPKISLSRRVSLDLTGPLKESRRQNVSKPPPTFAVDQDNTKFSAVSLPPIPENNPDDKADSFDKPFRQPSFSDASLLLGLRTHSNSNSPETIPGKGIFQNEGSGATDDVATGNDGDDMVPKNYPSRLSVAGDNLKLNSLHCFIREELLEIFVVDHPKDTITPPSTSVGKVGLRCVHCAQARVRNSNRHDEAPMAVFYPKSVSEIYRLVTSWQRCHLRKCKNIPPQVRSLWDEIRKSDKTRGKTDWWVISAEKIGLVDCTRTKAGGIRFQVNRKNSE